METPFQLHFLHCSATLWQSLMRFDADKWLVHWHVSNNSTGSDTGDGHNANDHHHVNEIAGSPADIVYLSPDSPNVLMTLDCTKTYLIGGIVDKSRKKVRWYQTKWVLIRMLILLILILNVLLNRARH